MGWRSPQKRVRPAIHRTTKANCRLMASSNVEPQSDRLGTIRSKKTSHQSRCSQARGNHERHSQRARPRFG